MSRLGDHRFVVVGEQRLSPDLQARVGLLLERNLDGGALYRGHACRTLRPFARALAFDFERRVIGHAAAFRVPCTPHVAVRGLGDVAVEAASRGRGIARCLCRLAVDACWRDRAEVVIAKTRPLRDVLADLGFEPVADFRFFHERDGLCVRHPDWMAVAAAQLPRPLRLHEGDF